MVSEEVAVDNITSKVPSGGIWTERGRWRPYVCQKVVKIKLMSPPPPLP